MYILHETLLRKLSRHHSHLTRKISPILSLKCYLFSCYARYKNYWKMTWEKRFHPWPLLSCVYGAPFTHLCTWIISHQYNESGCDFKENLDIHDILYHQKVSHLVNSLLLTTQQVLICGTIWRYSRYSSHNSVCVLSAVRSGTFWFAFIMFAQTKMAVKVSWHFLSEMVSASFITPVIWFLSVM